MQQSNTMSTSKMAKLKKGVSLVEEMEFDSDDFEPEQFKLKRVKERKVKYTSFDVVLRKAGLFGRYQIFCCVVVQYATIMWAGNASFQILGFLTPTNWICTDNNVTFGDLTRDSDNCAQALNCTNLQPVNVEFHSATIDFRLICDRSDIQTYLIGAYLIGHLFGSLFGGFLGDHVGRKRSFFSAQFLITMTSVLTVASNNWQTLMLFQVLNGFFFGIIQSTCFTLMLEYTDSKYRLIPNACFQWVLGYLVVALISWLNPSWRMYLIFINLISSPLFIGFLLFMESPRWLVARGRLYEAAEVLTDLASDRWNNTRVKFTAEQLTKIPRCDTRKFYTFLDLFCTKRMAIQSCLQMLATFSYSLVSSMFLVNLNVIEISIFAHFLLFGLLRIWVPVVAVVMDFKLPRFGRKHLFLTCSAAVWICFGIVVIALMCGVPTDSPLIYVVALLGVSINVSGLYMTILQINVVAFPTVTRCIAYGTLTVTDDVGTLLSTIFLTRLSMIWQPWPYVIAEFLTILTFVLNLWLQRESKFNHLPDTLEQIQQQHQQ